MVVFNPGSALRIAMMHMEWLCIFTYSKLYFLQVNLFIRVHNKHDLETFF